MKVIISLFLLGCTNNAITLAHKIDPCAQCDSVEIGWGGANSVDTAICIRGDEVWSCRVSTSEAKCDVIAKREPVLVAEACRRNK
jgi:hypothetical protein